MSGIRDRPYANIYISITEGGAKYVEMDTSA